MLVAGCANDEAPDVTDDLGAPERLVTSANLTEAAIHRNVEVGALVHDEAMAAKMDAAVDAWIANGVVIRM